MSALADQTALTGGGVTRLNDRMITAGLVQRDPCPTDRRISYAALTPAGRLKRSVSQRVMTMPIPAGRLIRRSRESPPPMRAVR